MFTTYCFCAFKLAFNNKTNCNKKVKTANNPQCIILSEYGILNNEVRFCCNKSLGSSNIKNITTIHKENKTIEMYLYFVLYLFGINKRKMLDFYFRASKDKISVNFNYNPMKAE